MTDVAFLIIYGLLFISGVFMLPAWLDVAALAKREGDNDYRLVALALAVNSLGTVLVFGTRMFYAFQTNSWAMASGEAADGTFAAMSGTIVLAGLGLFELSKLLLMVVRRHHGRIVVWRSYAAASLLWTAFAIGWMLWR